MPIDFWNPIPIGYYDVSDEEKNKCFYEFSSNKELIFNNMEPYQWRDNVSTTLTKFRNILTRIEFQNFFSVINKYAFFYAHEINHNINSFPLCMFNSWFNLTEKTGYQDWHDHYPSFISGVYYFDIQSKEQEEGIVFQSKNNFVNFTEHQNHKLFTFDYIPGRIILFPSSLTHRVPFKRTNGQRFSVSFNFNIPEQGR